jgi:two-component system, NarL family, invasion response regulator UvrY
MQYKIGIVDDHVLMADAIASMISQSNQYKVTFKAKNGKELQTKLSSSFLKPDLILMDINMPIINGIEATEWILKNHKTVKVLALTMNDDEISIIRMFKAGAKGYLLKDVSSDELFYAIDSVLTKGFYYSDFVTPIMMSSVFHKAMESDSITIMDLKDKEMEFLQHACSEKTYKEIAELMNVSPKTVDNYRDSLFQKLEVKSRVGLVLFAVKHNIISI